MWVDNFTLPHQPYNDEQLLCKVPQIFLRYLPVFQFFPLIYWTLSPQLFSLLSDWCLRWVTPRGHAAKNEFTLRCQWCLADVNRCHQAMSCKLVTESDKPRQSKGLNLLKMLSRTPTDILSPQVSGTCIVLSCIGLQVHVHWDEHRLQWWLGAILKERHEAC